MLALKFPFTATGHSITEWLDGTCSTNVELERGNPTTIGSNAVR